MISSLKIWLGLVAVAFAMMIVQNIRVLEFDESGDRDGSRSSFISDEFQPPIAARQANTTTVVQTESLSTGYKTVTKTKVVGNKTLRYHVRSLLSSNTTIFNISDYTGYWDGSVVEFERQEGVVIATKLHDAAYWPMLEQTMCLLHYAYNKRLQYDILVFATEPIPKEMVASLSSIVAPAKVTVVKDNDGLQNEIAKLSPLRRKNFLKSCQVSAPDNLTWWSKCPSRLAYNWQAEFRSWHIWKHPTLQAYKWMMWLDTDAFCSKEWTRDPMAVAIRHNMTILFDNFPQGYTNGPTFHGRIKRAFPNLTPVCHVQKTAWGHMVRETGNSACDGHVSGIPLIHGFFHITNLDFYRSPVVQDWAKILIGDGFLQRKFDDQVAVTVPAILLTPNQSWWMNRVGMELQVHHNGKLDGSIKVGGFLQRWHTKGGKEAFPQANGKCNVVAAG